MDTTPKQQALDLLKKANKVLIALPSAVTVDIMSSAVALELFLVKHQKEVDIVTSGTVPKGLEFLPAHKTILHQMPQEASLVIALDTQADPLDELSYKVEEKRVVIFLKPKKGKYTPEQVSFVSNQNSYDVIITLGAACFEDLGELYKKNTNLFYQTPKLVIDTKHNNEYYGAVNVVDITASSLGEMVTQLLMSWDELFIDNGIATALFGAIVAATHSFQAPQTTPQTLTLAATLIKKGADHQEVIRYLYKTKDFSFLKLWGRALARINTVEQSSLLYSVLNKSDFEKTNTTVASIQLVLQELLDNSTEFQVAAILAEVSTVETRVIIAAPPHIPLAAIAKKCTETNLAVAPLQGLYQYVQFDIAGKDLQTAEQEVVGAVTSMVKIV